MAVGGCSNGLASAASDSSAGGALKADPLDESCFRHFSPLLQVSQAYASLSGCRFRSGSFDGLVDRGGSAASAAAGGAPVEVPPQRARDPGPRLAAKLASAPAVEDFARRLRAGDAGLVEEVDRAYRIVMVESARNAMMGMFQALEMFPPSPTPAGVDDEDCAYEDVTAPLPEIAQRLYNDQVRRVSDHPGGAGGPSFAGRLERRAMTAAFIVDFAEGSGYALPPVPETQMSMLRELSARVNEETQRRGVQAEGQQQVREIFLRGLGAGAAAEKLRAEAGQWWSENWKKVALVTAGTVIFGAVGFAASIMATGGGQRRRDEDRGSEL